MHAVVLSAFYSLTHLISGFHIGNWVVEEENGFPRVRQLVIGLDSYASKLHQPAGVQPLGCPPFCLPTMPRHLHLSILLFTPFHHQTTSLSSLCLSSYLPAASYQFISPCCWLFHTLLHFHISHVLAFSFDRHPVYERPDRWFMLCISKIFALEIPKPQPEENKLATENTLGVRSIASERY